MWTTFPLEFPSFGTAYRRVAATRRISRASFDEKWGIPARQIYDTVSNKGLASCDKTVIDYFRIR
jgi:hypothetical protein